MSRRFTLNSLHYLCEACKNHINKLEEKNNIRKDYRTTINIENKNTLNMVRAGKVLKVSFYKANDIIQTHSEVNKIHNIKSEDIIMVFELANKVKGKVQPYFNTYYSKIRDYRHVKSLICGVLYYKLLNGYKVLNTEVTKLIELTNEDNEVTEGILVVKRAEDNKQLNINLYAFEDGVKSNVIKCNNFKFSSLCFLPTEKISEKSFNKEKDTWI